MTIRVTIDTLRKEVDEVQQQYPAWTRDNAFVHWFLQAFLVPDAETAARCVTGVSHDKGVDAVLVDENAGKAFLLQGKLHAGPTPPAEGRADVVSFAQLGRVLTGPKSGLDTYLSRLDPNVARQIQTVRSRIQRRNFELHLYYVTTGKCSGPLKAEAEGETAQATGNVSISVLDRADILTLLVDYLGGAAPPVPFLDLKIDARGVVGSDGAIQRYDSNEGVESWILSMAARHVAALYERAGDRLFSRNIRGWLGDTTINDEIRETLKENPEDFWYFNNGITIVCDGARKTSERGQAILRVTNPQVINGQQTTRQMALQPTKDASVVVRVISVRRTPERGSQQFEEFVSNMVAATNQQNPIFSSDLRSNDQRQVALERDLAKLRYHYIRKRQSKKEARRSLGHQHWFPIKKEEMAQAVAACEFDPVVVRSGKEGLFSLDEPYYDKIYDGRPPREYLSMYWLGRVVKYHGSGYPDRAYAKWLVQHFLWKQVSSFLRPRAAADYFRERCERDQWFEALDDAAQCVYRTALDFYRARRGKGAQAVDVSNFFYRPHQHDRFQSFWRGAKNKRRYRFRRALREFRSELREGVSH